MSYIEQLNSHSSLRKRREDAAHRCRAICREFETFDREFAMRKTTVYLAGSLGRGDVGQRSDLDLFLLAEGPDSARSRLGDVELLANVIAINRKLGYGAFSNDGQYLTVYSLDKMVAELGHPHDDSENLFTARMLLLLESKCACNQALYDAAIDKVIGNYFRDCRGKRSFRPLFLINDILRYWRTLCLNYEMIRENPNRPWRKKNINLKFSRMLTVFGTVLPLVAKPISTLESARELVRLSPHERFAQGLDSLGDRKLSDEYATFLNDYESFLCWKEVIDSEEMQSDRQFVKESRIAADRFSKFIHKAVTHGAIKDEYRRFLVI